MPAGAKTARLLLAGLLLSAPAALQAKLYRWVDEAGVVHFSDTPHAGAQEVRPQRVETVPARKAPFLEIPFVRRRDAMIVQGEVNGAPARFVVDTGASVLVIPPAVAEAAGISLRGVPRVRMETANGLVEVPTVRVQRLAIGPLVREGVEAVVQRISRDPTLGLLGMNILSDYRVEVDQARSVLRLHPR